MTSVLDLIGDTPIVQLQKIHPSIFVKLENLNPGGSVKDRIGVGMIARAERNGELKKAERSSSPPPATQASPWRSSACAWVIA